ncbi:E3 ubiquitin-protein ligase RNF4-like isoform X2 [Hibiscus syriacus]|uniref:E3 ubiquitin-protein ligase RNF4-like isoform X2 n=1 Tax=Hibiscus syriacus TaxID=106335 RepID=UPI001922922F|nr:E3 ubiquitin-protein ligase RNF4-like isoform X2 [Hibiscus syriacus]
MLSIRFSHCIKVLLRLQSSDIALKNHNLNMSTLEVRGSSLRGYRRRKAVLDLNVPPSEIRELEGTSQQAGYEEQTIQSMQLGPPATIDVDAIDDDAIESSATSFAETRNNSRRNRGRTVVDVDSGVAHMCPTHNNPNRLRRLPTSPNVIDWESSTQSVVEEIIVSQPPPKAPTFNCPICMGPLTEETSTRCGHIFCKACIKAALAVQAKCPTCRKRVTVRGLIRVFLPSVA